MSPRPPVPGGALSLPAPSRGPAAEAPELPIPPVDLEPEEVRARFRWARRGGHPAWLWPDLTVDAWREALGEIERAVRAALAGTGPPPRLGGDPHALGIAAYTSGTGPLLGYWIETGAVEADPAAAALLRLHLDHNRRRMARLGREAARVVSLLHAEGPVPTVVKGMHTAFAFFPEPGTRPLADLDLLVRPADLPAAERALRRAGYRPGSLQRRPYKREWSPGGAAGVPRSLSLTHAADPFGLDVHASLDRNFFGVASVRFEGAPTVMVEPPWGAGPPVRVLRQPLLLLLLATHASEGLHGLGLIRLVELVRVIRREAAEGRLEWGELLAAAEGAGALRFAYPALDLCERLAPGTIPPRVLERFAAAATPAMRRVLARLTPSTAQRLDRLSLEERLMWAGSAGERARRLAHFLWPAPAGLSLAELGGIYARRAWRLARGRVER